MFVTFGENTHYYYDHPLFPHPPAGAGTRKTNLPGPAGAGGDHSLIFVIANKPGRGYANQFGGDHDWAEGAVLFHSAQRPLENRSIIHEFLHLFSAVDLYETDAQTKENSDRMEKMYPKEVMHNHYFPLKELQLSPLTAWLVGLSDKQEPWFESFLLSP